MTLEEIVRDQVLKEGPDIASENWGNQAAYIRRCSQYVDYALDEMTNTELLRRISDALEKRKLGV